MIRLFHIHSHVHIIKNTDRLTAILISSAHAVSNYIEWSRKERSFISWYHGSANFESSISESLNDSSAYDQVFQNSEHFLRKKSYRNNFEFFVISKLFLKKVQKFEQGTERFNRYTVVKQEQHASRNAVVSKEGVKKFNSARAHGELKRNRRERKRES